jgi:hypothetical protein
MNTKVTTTARNYWLALAAMYGLTLSDVTMAEWPWPLIMGAAFILFGVLHGLRYRQVGRNVRGKLATASPGVGVVGAYSEPPRSSSTALRLPSGQGHSWA